MTPERAADFARALTLVAPGSPAAPVLDRPRRVRLRPGARRGVRRGLRASSAPRRRATRSISTTPRSPRAADERPPASARPRAGDARAGDVAGARATRRGRRARRSRSRWRWRATRSGSRRKRFDALEPRELAQLYRLMSRLELATPLRRTRRHERGRHGRAIDLRRTLRGEPAHRRRADPPRAPPPPRAAPRAAGDAVRHLGLDGALRPRLPAVPDLRRGQRPARRGVRVRDAADPPHARAAPPATPSARSSAPPATAPDWSSGTRIGDALKAFNDRHGRRGMARGAVVVILSDGWERGDPALVGREMARLSRLAHRIVWVNPRVGAERVLGAGRRDGRGAAALRRARQRPQLRGARRGRRRDRRRRRRRAAAPVERPAAERAEPWASATPVPGSSVAMPSGLRPEPGQHDPGMGRPVTTEKTCIYPGCERPAVPPHPLGGPQPAFCDLEEHNALTAHQERQRLEPRRTTRGASG